MPVEWAWLEARRRDDVPDRGLKLPPRGGCVTLLLHGLTGSPAELAYLAFRLHREGRAGVRCPQLANHGQPLGVLARTTRRELYESARQAFVAARDEARTRGAPLVVGGLSLGAILSLMLAAEFPADVAGVVCLSPTLFYDGWNVPWLRRLLPLARFTPLKNFSYFREGEPFGLKDEALRARVAEQYAGMSLRDSEGAADLGYAHFPVRLFCEMQPLIERCKRILPRVTSPVLLVQAERDDMTGPRNARYIYRRVASERRELIMLGNSYHVVSADLERASVGDHMLRFCGSLQAAGAPVREKAVAHA
ncbi:MAG TPA: alpha/beta fold hydrolase [Burkholderiales bacterium]|nr:alpha/beta fold hydrolase [Burkholderiales bacterium]